MASPIPSEEGEDDISTLASIEHRNSLTKYTSQQTALQKLGWKPIATFFIAPIVLLAVMGFLAFLWIPSRQKLWVTIVTTSWLSRSVTICTLIIQIAVDLLTGLAVAMLAAQVLENGSVQLSGLASIFILRAVASSPLELFLSFR
ncbi:hypothetical protein M426DRAFT_17892 [Hypoxylon sp. CI-4A]|nr:hypothetical protein M426DRAFT_17892 [Hypoxylon sp. CI-4A]